MMKKIIMLVLLVAGSMAVKAQELVWTNNLDKAIEISNQTKKPLLLFLLVAIGVVGAIVYKMKYLRNRNLQLGQKVMLY